MSVKKRKGSPYWQIKFQLAGISVRRTSQSTSRAAAEELEEQLRRDLWRQIKLGERRFTWDDAVEQFTKENSAQKSWERTQRCITILSEYLAEAQLVEIDYARLLELREFLDLRTYQGRHHKFARPWQRSTVNRVLAVAGSILSRAASSDWKMIDQAPAVPLHALPRTEPKWVTREQAHVFLGKLPVHSRDMTILSLATGLRRGNVTHLRWSQIDMAGRCCWIPGDEAKGRAPISVPLNEDAMFVLARWEGQHAEYVFHFRQRAPIYQVTTAMWRRIAKEAGLPGVTFHSMRHSWASWQVQSGTPLKMLQELGGWASLQMPMRYAHVSPGHLAAYAERALLGTETGTLAGPKKKARVSPCLNGKGGTRTLDPGIMRTARKRMA